jgi:hypothetical protein
LHTVTKSEPNEASLWKITLQKRGNSHVDTGTFFPFLELSFLTDISGKFLHSVFLKDISGKFPHSRGKYVLGALPLPGSFSIKQKT